MSISRPRLTLKQKYFPCWNLKQINGKIDYVVKKGDRVAQFVIHFNVDLNVAWGEIDDTIRGNKGFGSSGK